MKQRLKALGRVAFPAPRILKRLKLRFGPFYFSNQLRFIEHKLQLEALTGLQITGSSHQIKLGKSISKDDQHLAADGAINTGQLPQVENTDTYLQPRILLEFGECNAALSQAKAGAASRTVRAKHKQRIPTA